MNRIFKSMALLFVFAGLSQGSIFAATMQFSPSTGNFGMHCRNTGNVVVDTNTNLISAIDAKIFANNIVWSGVVPLLSAGFYPVLGSGGNSLVSVVYPWQTYGIGSPYFYVNWYAGNLAQRLMSGDANLFSFFFASTGNNLTGLMDFYYISGSNYDDSNMQSGVVNAFKDVLTIVNSGNYSFVPNPCVLDTDPVLFMGYSSGATYTLSIDSGFLFVIYDYTGDHIIGYNHTSHYRFQSGSANTGNLSNYISVGSNDIDNQYGVNSGSISVFLSGLSMSGTGILLSPTLLYSTGLNCNFSYAGPGYPLTWNRNSRGYTCMVPFSGINFSGNQTVLVIISGADNANLNGQSHTGSVRFTLNIAMTGTIIPPSGGGGGGGGGGSSLMSDNCFSPGSSLPGANVSGQDYSNSFYDDDCRPAGVHEAAPFCPIAYENSPFNKELTDGYLFSYGVGITNKCPIETANLPGSLLRKDLVKMLVYFSIKVLGLVPDETKQGCDVYADLKPGSQQAVYAKLGCQLEIMGMEHDGVTPLKNFMSENLVSRAQFGTTLSRVIFGRRYNGNVPFWFSKHLEGLKKYGIMKIIGDPYMTETKGYVMVMFKRAYDSGLVEQFRATAAAKNGAVALISSDY